MHPAKLEVRFEDESKVFKAIYHAIKDSLLKGDLIPDKIRIELNKEFNDDQKKDYTTASNTEENKMNMGNIIAQIYSSKSNDINNNTKNDLNQYGASQYNPNQYSTNENIESKYNIEQYNENNKDEDIIENKVENKNFENLGVQNNDDNGATKVIDLKEV